jgi:hypothetical protein
MRSFPNSLKQAELMIEKVLQGSHPVKLANRVVDLIEGPGPYPVGSFVKVNKAWTGQSTEGASVTIQAGESVSIVDPHKGPTGYEKLVLLADGVTKVILPLAYLGESEDAVQILAGAQEFGKAPTGINPELSATGPGDSTGSDKVGTNSPSNPNKDGLANQSFLPMIPTMGITGNVSSTMDQGPSGHETPSATGTPSTLPATVQGLPAPDSIPEIPGSAPGTIGASAQGQGEPTDISQKVGSTTPTTVSSTSESTRQRAVSLKALRLYMESMPDVTYRRIDKVIQKLSETTNTSAINKTYSMIFNKDKEVTLEELEGLFSIKEGEEPDDDEIKKKLDDLVAKEENATKPATEGDATDSDDSETSDDDNDSESSDNSTSEQDDSDTDKTDDEDDPATGGNESITKTNRRGQTEIIESVFSKYDSFKK